MYDAIFFKKSTKEQIFRENFMNKQNLFSIGEIAKSIGITRKIILNYETKGLITPDKKDGATGNRYYTIDTFTQIRTIRLFQNLGFSLDMIRAYFDDTADITLLIKHLEKMRDDLNSSIEKLYERAGKNKKQIRKIKVERQTVYAKEFHTHSIADRTVILRETALEAMRKYKTDISRRMYFIEYPINDTDNLTYAASVTSESQGENILNIPSFNAISFFHHGAYEDIPKAREMLIAYAKENNIKITGKCRHIYLEGPPQRKEPSKFITQIILPIDE